MNRASSHFLNIRLLIVGVFLSTSCAPGGVTEETPLSDRWVLQYVGAWNPDGRPAEYLARRTGRNTTRVSGKILDAQYVDDDCVVYTHSSALYAVCGDHEPVFITLTGDERVALNPAVIRVRGRELPIAGIKQAARDTAIEHLGGKWFVQQEVLPADPRFDQFFLFREDPYGQRYRTLSPVLAYRYVDDDCLLYVYQYTLLILDDPSGKLKGNSSIAATCAGHAEIFLGHLETPADIMELDDVVVDGAPMALNALKQRALAAPLVDR